MSVNPRGIRSPIPAGTLIGRARGHGKGAAELVTAQGLAANLMASGAIPPMGGPAVLQPIATHTILANPTGSSAAPIATTLPAPAAGLTWTYGASSITITLANDLAAVEGIGTTGLAARTATDTWTTRTLTGPAAGITVSNGDGVAGNPTLALANDLAAVEGLSGTGAAVRTATDTWTTVAAGASGNVLTSNGTTWTSAASSTDSWLPVIVGGGLIPPVFAVTPSGDLTFVKGSPS